jgi:hypothetical protein
VALEHACQARLRSAIVARLRPYKITVVVHVVHNPAAPAEKISVAQVKSQIAVINKDYRAKNPDKSKTPVVFSGLVADPMIEFALATKDPAGHATNGITSRDQPDLFSDRNNPVKSKAARASRPGTPYLNIWVCTLGRLLGYAQFPAAARPMASWFSIPPLAPPMHRPFNLGAPLPTKSVTTSACDTSGACAVPGALCRRYSQRQRPRQQRSFPRLRNGQRRHVHELHGPRMTTPCSCFPDRSLGADDFGRSREPGELSRIAQATRR